MVNSANGSRLTDYLNSTYAGGPSSDVPLCHSLSVVVRSLCPDRSQNSNFRIIEKSGRWWRDARLSIL